MTFCNHRALAYLFLQPSHYTVMLQIDDLIYWYTKKEVQQILTLAAEGPDPDDRNHLLRELQRQEMTDVLVQRIALCSELCDELHVVPFLLFKSPPSSSPKLSSTITVVASSFSASYSGVRRPPDTAPRTLSYIGRMP